VLVKEGTMGNRSIVVVGGGLAGLSTACYALANGWEVTIVEHNETLGGVCTAWRRGPYLMDGCIHWLTGGPFTAIYEELGIVPPVEVHALREFMTLRARDGGWSLTIGCDLETLRRDLRRLAPEDGSEIDRMIDGARRVADLSPGIDRPPELTGLRDRLRSLWEMRHEIGVLAHFRGSVEEFGRAHLRSPRLRSVLSQFMPPDAPMLFALMILGYLERGWLSRPLGGTERFRDALVRRFEHLGGIARLRATVEEVVVRHDRACGVRLADGTIVDADIVVSTSSMPETVLQLLGGRYGADGLRHRMDEWKLFDAIVLLSYGVALPLQDVPSSLVVFDMPSFLVGGFPNDHLYVRVYNDDPSFAPPGHSVVQLMLATDYDWWAKRGSDYAAAKEDVARRGIELLAPHVPGIADAVRVVDVATPITFWRSARSWRGAFEGWKPTTETFFGHVDKTLPGLDAFYMAGQWVEPGGGVPTALMSGRQLVQILCAREGRTFVPQHVSG
jgi:phytoene dehydrogenase-like protein